MECKIMPICKLCGEKIKVEDMHKHLVNEHPERHYRYDPHPRDMHGY